MNLGTIVRNGPFHLLGPMGMRKVHFIVPYVRGRDVLDVGVVEHHRSSYSKPDWVHGHIARESASCVGIDILAEDVRFLRSTGLDVRVADARNFDLGRTFDVVVAGDIIEHIDDPGSFLRCARRHLRAEGRIVITTPNPWFFLRGWQAMLGGVSENSEHTAWYSMGTLAALLERNGFTLERAVYGSGENRPWRWWFLIPKHMRHTSIWIVASVRGGQPV